MANVAYLTGALLRTHAFGRHQGADVLVLEYERRNQRKPQHRLAAEATLPQPYISLIEQGRLVPTQEELVRLANALGVHPPALLMERIQPPTVAAGVSA